MGFLDFGWRKGALRRRFYPPAFRGMYDRLQDAIDQYVTPNLRRVGGVDVTDEPRGNEGDPAALVAMAGVLSGVAMAAIVAPATGIAIG